MSKEQETQQREARIRIVLPTGDAFERNVTGAENHIGRGARSDILIVDPEVSTSHALLAFYGDSYFIVDEGGEGGTFVNGERVTKPRKLSNGDVIKMGKSQITFMLKLGAQALEAQLAEAASSGTPVEAVASAEAGVSQEASAEAGGSGEEKEKKKKKKDKEKKDEQADSVVEAKASSGSEGEKEKKKDKKDKDKGKEKKDERVKAAMVRAWGGIIATVLSVVLTVILSIMLTRRSDPPPVQVTGGGSQPKKLANLSDIKKISGGKYEASGAVAVPDANGILFVDDSEPAHVFYMPVNELGEQAGPVKAIPLGVSVMNPEGISQFGPRFMVVGSLSTLESNNAGGIAVFEFDPVALTASKAVALTGVRKFLFDNVPELKTWADKTGIDGGLNIEGITIDPDPQHPRVLLGLRGPVLSGRALIVPIKIINREATLTIENLAMAQPNAIQLNLNGQAIRDIQYDNQLRSFLIISGAPETEEKTTFTLWAWSGEGNQAKAEDQPQEQSLLDPKMKPEGVTHLKIGSHGFVFIVGDANSYAKIDYISR